MSDNKEVSSKPEDGLPDKPAVGKPPVVRKKTIVDVMIDRASTSSADIIKNVIGPGILDIVLDSAHGMIDALLAGNAGTNRPRRNVRTGQSASFDRNKKNTTFSYNSISNKPESRKRTLSEYARSNHDFESILFENRHEAAEVIDKMRAQIVKYDVATVDDLYSFVGIDPTAVDNAWGWDSMDGAQVRRIRNAFILDLPEPSPL